MKMSGIRLYVWFASIYKIENKPPINTNKINLNETIIYYSAEFFPCHLPTVKEMQKVSYKIVGLSGVFDNPNTMTVLIVLRV